MSGGGGGSSKIKDTPEQRQLAEVAAEKWNYAQENLAPIENAYMESVGDMTSDANMSYIAGRTLQSQQQAVSDASQQVGMQLGQSGVDPSSGRYQTAMSDIALGGASAGGETLGRAQFEQENQQIQGLQNIVAIGQGESGQAQAGLAGVAAQSAQDARQSAATQFNRRSANLQLLGQVAGAGTANYLNQPSQPQGLNLYDQVNTGGV
ncbi:hypothetical protein J7J47_11830 [Halomonas sp. ISL-60]|uniref:hypothetical protein n=1 Tax=Halomonas sp. ISL-56 TaxID=2819149 RepID=UPI001BE5F775|nr:hypothetical protein [Halomonas sp. ISL-56]MBT2772912.1 hypothetical protein [Halomonas sp. ISL-60]MBT2799959.1 hypothetical protein [Halomonas sp. ISL-56]